MFTQRQYKDKYDEKVYISLHPAPFYFFRFVTSLNIKYKNFYKGIKDLHIIPTSAEYIFIDESSLPPMTTATFSSAAGMHLSNSY